MRNLINSLIGISKYANISSVPHWQIVYFNDRVQKNVLSMPSGVLADYLRLTEAMALYGADLRMPHSRALGAGLFELRPKDWTRALLHASWKSHCHIALFHQENTRNARRRHTHCT